MGNIGVRPNKRRFWRGVGLLLSAPALLVLLFSAPSVDATPMSGESHVSENVDDLQQSGQLREDSQQSGQQRADSQSGEPREKPQSAEPHAKKVPEALDEVDDQKLDGQLETPVQRRAPGKSTNSTEAIPLSDHYGPSPGVPYSSKYTGGVYARNPNPVKFDPQYLYATGYIRSNQEYRGAAALDENRLENGITGLFGSWGPGEHDVGLGYPNSSSPTGFWTGSTAAFNISTMALDAGHYGRTGKTYFWHWGTPGALSDLETPRPDGTRNVPVAVFYNDPNDNVDNPANDKPSEILFVPLPGAPNFNFWSGGEVHQPTGRIYFSGGEDSHLGTENYRFMIYDPETGDYRIIANPKPKTDADRSVNNWWASADMALDGEGNIYSIVYPDANGEKWMLKIEPVDRTDEDSDWVYSKVLKWEFPDGTNPQALDMWGMAFHNGHVYFTAGKGVGAAGYYTLVEGDPLTGKIRQIPGKATDAIIDLAADGSLAALNGVVYSDDNRDGKPGSNEKGVANQLVQLHDSSGKVVGEQITNESGEYSFLLGYVQGADYYVRLVQPQVNLGTDTSPQLVNAAQTGITFKAFLDEGDPYRNGLAAGSFGKEIPQFTPPTISDGGYVDYPALSDIGAPSAQFLSPDDMALYGKVTLNSDLDVSTVDFGINAKGSWGDAGNNQDNYRTTAAQNGPRHINPGNWTDSTGAFSDSVKENPSIYLGPTPGWYDDGVTSGDRNVDGVTLSLGGQKFALDNQLLAPGVEYSLEATVSGKKAADGTVNAWLQDPLSPIKNPAFPSLPTSVGTGTGNTRHLTLDVPPGTVSNPASNKFLRVDASTAHIETFWNTETDQDRWFAPAKGSDESKSRNWVIDGEVEDYSLQFKDGIIRVQVEGSAGDYTIGGFVNATGTTSTATVTNSSELIGSYPVTNPSQDVSFNLKMPQGVEIDDLTLTRPNGSKIVSGEAKYSVVNPGEAKVTVDSETFGNNGSHDVVIDVSTITPVKISGWKVLGYPTGYEPLIPEWEITATDTTGVAKVISGGTPVEVPEGTYTIGERYVGTPSEANKFVLKSMECNITDISGALKPDAFDSDTFELTVTDGDLVSCEVDNSAAVIQLYDNPIGISGPTWDISGSNQKDSNFDFHIPASENNKNVLVQPGSYEFQVNVPDGIALVGTERLDIEKPACAAKADDPGDAPEQCWTILPKKYDVTVGSQNIIRITTTSPQGMPSLPLAGGLGTYIFVIGAGTLAALTALAYLHWHQRKAMPRHKY